MSLTDEQEQDLREAIASLEDAFDELSAKIEKSGVLVSGADPHDV
jgi:hypothetical protein